MKVVGYFYPDMLESTVYVQSELSLEEYFDEIRRLCELHLDTLHRTHILIYAKEGGDLILSLTGSTEKLYNLADKYKEYDSAIWDICKKYFRDAKERNKTRIKTVEDLRNTDVIIKGYTIPQDYDYGPDYVSKCKMSEAFGKMKEIVASCPEMFYNLNFDVWTRDEEYLFGMDRDLKKIYLGRDNEFDLTKEMVKEALGIKPEDSLPKEVLMQKVIFVFRPDAMEPDTSFENSLSLEECFDSIRKHCEERDQYLDRMEIWICTEDKQPMFTICAIVPNYRVFEDYRELEPVVFDIYSRYFDE